MRRRWRAISRDTVLFVAGLLGVLHETLVYQPSERPFLLAIFGAMMGFPFVLSADRSSGKTGVDTPTVTPRGTVETAETPPKRPRSRRREVS